MTFKEYKRLILSDLYRIEGSVNVIIMLRHLIKGEESYQYNFWMRTCNYTQQKKITKYSIYPFSKIMLNHYKFKFGISIPYETKIDSGLYIGHFGGIVVSGKSIIGKNLNISQGVTLGMANRGPNKGYPVIGDNVYIGPGAKIVGAVKIGNNVAIGANCVVTKNIPDNAVVVGVPGKIISYNGTSNYVENTDY